MSIHAAIRHQTRYNYSKEIGMSPQVVRLRPAPHCRTPVEAYSLRVSPEPNFINWVQDPFGNYQARIVFPEPVDHFHIDVELIADMTVINPFDFFVEERVEHFPFVYNEELKEELSPYMKASDVTDGLLELSRSLLAKTKKDKIRTIDFLVEVNQAIAGHINYVIRMEPGVQSCKTTLDSKSGSCRDSAHLLVQLLRTMGFASRFVSGYLIQLRADQKDPDGPSGPEADFTDLHAWTEVYIPGAGWVGLDPTSGLFAGEGHIPLAATPEPGNAAPVTGAIGKCEVEFDFHMEVNRVRESPRVTLPFTEEVWNRIVESGNRVDAKMDAMGMGLVLGGEPTFVSRFDMESPEWTLEADGPTKRYMADQLLHRLRERFSTGGLLFHGQGKWYPGEPLPRWAYGCYFRKDGESIWSNPALFARPGISNHSDLDQAREFATRLIVKLGLDPLRLIPAYEDYYYLLWKEGRLPIPPGDVSIQLKSEKERERIRQKLEQSAEPAGFVLPLAPGTGGNWISGSWPFRREKLYLIPGESPLGYRLPLDAVPGALLSDDLYFQEERDPMAPLKELPAHRFFARTGQTSSQVPEPVSSEATGTGSSSASGPPPMEGMVGPDGNFLMRTAMCFEVREGILRVFLPPLSFTENFLDLVARIERVAEEMSLPILLEGYPPPSDHRIEKFQITPDPGVIEVNIHPSSSWSEIVSKNEILYEEARLVGLGTEKFLVDGRHSGTGGGNHVTLGGQSPARSPFFRRPDVLASMLSYWQNHPVLSYFFSGLFIGPTSQHPRIDEARHENLYELETALREIQGSRNTPPWFLDRLLRNLLVDLTGNTHRTEFCIDKLHSPDSLSGRLGILEIRSFEMPPHPRMSSLQSLLVRSLFSMFWERPLPMDRPLVRWGTALHDRFLLPHYQWLDLEDVVSELKLSGYDLEAEWFQPFFEFRFPLIGEFEVRDIRVELRTALEVWNVLGEEVSQSGTARYVDSSCERLQVRVDNYMPERYAILVNGVKIPLQKTERNGQAVAGVRFKAWSPPSSLHPQVGAMPSLVFEVYDTWSGRSLGGATYHVSHPGGRNYTTFPVNAFEAESRRIARFHKNGHSQGFFNFVEAPVDREFPHTLDLRRYYK